MKKKDSDLKRQESWENSTGRREVGMDENVASHDFEWPGLKGEDRARYDGGKGKGKKKRTSRGPGRG